MINNQQNKESIETHIFSLEIHTFFSSKKNVNLKRKVCMPLENGFVRFRHAAFFPQEAVKTSSASAQQTFSLSPLNFYFPQKRSMVSRMASRA